MVIKDTKCIYVYMCVYTHIQLVAQTVKNLPKCGRLGFDPWVRKIPWRRNWQPTPVILPGESHGHRSLAGYNLWGRKKSATTEWLTHTHTHTQKERVRHCIILTIIIISNAYAYYGPGIVLNILHAPPHLCREHMIITIFQVGKLSSENLHKLLRIISFIKFQTFNLNLYLYVSNNLRSWLVHYTASLKVFTV